MANPSAQELFQGAVKAAKAKNLTVARKLIQASIRKDPNNDLAWLVFASIAPDDRQKLIALKKTLEINPGNQQALDMVRGMGIDPAKVIAAKPQQPTPTPEPPTEVSTSAFYDDFDDEDEFDEDAAFLRGDTLDDPPADRFPSEPSEPSAPEPRPGAFLDDAPEPEPEPPIDPTIPPPYPERPVSFAERLRLYADQAEQAAAEYLKTPEIDGVEWVKKDRNRAGENEIVLVRVAAATGLMTFIGLPLIIIGVILWNTPLVQGLVAPPTQRVSGLITQTFTPTPLTTPTASPGFTPTASITPSPVPTEQFEAFPPPTETPTVDAEIRPGDPNNINPTDVYLPGVADRAAENAVVLINRGSAPVALQTVQAERENIGRFDGNIYYTEALALARTGDAETALEFLEDGETLRQQEAPQNTDYQAAMNAAFADVYLQLAKDAFAEGNPGLGNQQLSRAEQSARDAIRFDSRWAEPYLILIERHKLANNFNAANNIIEEARQIPALLRDVRFIVERGEIAFLQEDYVTASYQAFLALYIDPASAAAHDLRTRIALALGQTNLATLYAQDYIFYNPQRVAGWDLLGRARLQEGNINLALEAFTEAIKIGNLTDQPIAVDALINRADIYASRGQLTEALADITAAVEATNNPDLRRRQMYLTLEAANPRDARTQAETLQEEGVISIGEANYIRAAALRAINGTDMAEADWRQILTFIESSFGTIPAEIQPRANLLRARAYIEIGEPQSALTFAQSAINAGELAEGYLLQAEALAGQGNFDTALLAYEYVLTLDQLNPLPDDLREAAQVGIELTLNQQAEAQANATATAAAR